MKAIIVLSIFIMTISLIGCKNNDNLNLEVEEKISEEINNENMSTPKPEVAMDNDTDKNANVKIQYTEYCFAVEAYKQQEYLDAFNNLLGLDETILSQNADYEKGSLENIKNECKSHFIEIGEAAYEKGDYETAYNSWNYVKDELDFEDEFKLNGLYPNGIYRMVQHRFYPRQTDTLENYIEFSENKVIASGLNILDDGVYTFKIVYPEGTGSRGRIVIDNTELMVELGIQGGDIIIDGNKFCIRTNLEYYDRLDKEYKEKMAQLSAEESRKYTLSQTEPYIGMTSEELIECAWGKPKKKNISEFSFGTYEQWCYSGGRYAYLENDKVTSLQYSK